MARGFWNCNLKHTAAQMTTTKLLWKCFTLSSLSKSQKSQDHTDVHQTNVPPPPMDKKLCSLSHGLSQALFPQQKTAPQSVQKSIINCIKKFTSLMSQPGIVNTCQISNLGCWAWVCVSQDFSLNLKLMPIPNHLPACRQQ